MDESNDPLKDDMAPSSNVPEPIPFDYTNKGIPSLPGNAKIMVVDDEPINCKVVQKYLSLAGYSNFITITDSTQTMEIIRRELPDVILLDIMMPQVSGLDILEQVRHDTSLSQIPLIILTATSDEKTKQQALELGATDFLAKPLDVNDLLPRVRNALILKAHYDHLTTYATMLETQVEAQTIELRKVNEETAPIQ